VQPGITGWAQVNGRNALPWSQKFELDVWYVDNHSLALDLRIMLKTVAQVLRRSGIAHHGTSTMPEFTGN
jgi:sugar transferase EpsL